MSNNLSFFKSYSTLLDEVYKSAALTADLDSDSSIVQQGANANEIIIPKLDMSGLGDYSRNDGYVSGDVTLTNETVKYNYERGRMFTVDAIDNEETAGLAFGRLSGEFIRTKVAPEVDAVRFAQYAGTASISTATPGSFTDGVSVLEALVEAVAKMDEDEVPQDQRYLYITPTLYNLMMAVDTTKSKEILDAFALKKKVPQSRFYTAIDLKDGKTVGEEAGGYAKATDAKDINFMIIHKPALMQLTKHATPKVITPEANQHADAWKFGYRIYALNDVYENKVAGIYVSHKA